MEKYYFVVNLVVYSIIPTLVALYVTERVKGSVKNSFDRKLEEVKKEHSLEISQFQTELNHLKSKENFKFTKLHEKRLEILQKVYEHLNEHLHLLTYSVISLDAVNKECEPIIDTEKFKEEYRTLHSDSFKYIKKNFIFFSKELEDKLREFFTISAKIYTNNEVISILKPSAETIGMAIDYDSLEAEKLISEILIPIKNEIEMKFRELLGD